MEGNQATEPTAPTADGYTFGGWYKDAGCTEAQKYLFSAAVTGNLDLYAKWTKNSGGSDPGTPEDDTPTSPGDDTPINPGVDNPNTGAPLDPNVPKTGDNSNMGLWLALALASLGMMFVIIVYGKKLKRSR